MREVIKTADWVIDLGPEGGDKGGKIVAVGTPEEVAEEARSYTGHYLKPLLGKPGAASAFPVQAEDASEGEKPRRRRSKVKEPAE